MKEKFLSIILHPFFSALIISLVIIYFLPDYFKKYKIELKTQEIIPRSNTRIYFQDLANNDHKSEKILCEIIAWDMLLLKYSRRMVIIMTNGISLLFIQELYSGTIWFLYINKNGYKEIYHVTQKSDSIFLNITEPYVKNGINKKNIFIDTIVRYNEKYHLFPGEIKEYYDDSDKNNTVIFALCAGYGALKKRL